MVVGFYFNVGSMFGAGHDIRDDPLVAWRSITFKKGRSFSETIFMGDTSIPFREGCRPSPFAFLCPEKAIPVLIRQKLKPHVEAKLGPLRQYTTAEESFLGDLFVDVESEESEDEDMDITEDW